MESSENDCWGSEGQNCKEGTRAWQYVIFRSLYSSASAQLIIFHFRISVKEWRGHFMEYRTDFGTIVFRNDRSFLIWWSKSVSTHTNKDIAMPKDLIVLGVVKSFVPLIILLFQFDSLIWFDIRIFDMRNDSVNLPSNRAKTSISWISRSRATILTQDLSSTHLPAVWGSFRNKACISALWISSFL